MPALRRPAAGRLQAVRTESVTAEPAPATSAPAPASPPPPPALPPATLIAVARAIDAARAAANAQNAQAQYDHAVMTLASLDVGQQQAEDGRRPWPVRFGISCAILGTWLAVCGSLSFFRAVGAGVLMSPALFLLICFALVNIVSEAGVTYPFRELAAKIPLIGGDLYAEDAAGKPEYGLLVCSMCLGLWMGTALSALGVRAFPVAAGGTDGMLALAVHGLLASGASFIVHVVLDRLGAYKAD